MKEIKAYQTSDGVIFEDMQSAIDREQVLSLGDWLDEHEGISWNHTNPNEVAHFICAEFTLTRK
jgi:hypothetical protein